MKTHYKNYCDTCGNYQTTFDKDFILETNPGEQTPKCIICESELEETSATSVSKRDKPENH